MKRLFLIYILLLMTSEVMISKEQYIFTQISRKEGLSSTINCIYKEKDGDIWIGTPEGLYAFNGHNLKYFDDSLFCSRFVLNIKEDTKGGLWILTDNWIMHRKKGEKAFRHLTYESPYYELPFYSMCQDDEGIWFGSHGSIYRYTFKDDSFSLFCNLEGKEGFVCALMNKVGKSSLLCSSNTGSILVNTKTKKVSEAVFSPLKEVSATMTDSKGRLWIAFYNNGIRVYEPDGTHIKTYTGRNSSLSNDLVLCFTEKDSKIWAGTDGGGINIIDPENDRIEVLSHIAGDSSSFPAHSIKSIYTDNYGNIWAGSTRDGIIRISHSGMKTHTDSHIGLSSGLSNPTVLCLFQEENDESIWIGTDGEGVNRYDPKNKEFTHYKNTLKTKIVSIATYSKTEVAISVYADRIWLLNKNTGAIRPLKVNNEALNYFMKYTGRSLVMSNGNNGEIYFMTNSVMRFDKKTGLTHNVSLRPGVKSIGNMFPIGISDKGLYLHDFTGIYRINEEEDILEKITEFNDCTINSAYLGTDGDIWLATSLGLCRYNEITEEHSFISTNLFSSASTVVWDGISRVWIGADESLFAYIPDKNTFAMFGESDGASPNEYLYKPRLRSREGDVYIGGIHGLVSIDSQYKIDAEEIPVLKLYNLSADRKTIHADKDGIYEVPRYSKLLNISVSTQETDIFRQKMYRFSISGSGKEYEQTSPTLEIQELPKPGKYDVLVSCTRRNGDWTEPSKIMTIRIPAPWYLSGWFITGVLIFLVIIISSIIIGLMHRKASKLQLALKEQEQKVYEEKVRMLINISHELRTPLTLIMAPLKRLIGSTDPQDNSFPTLNRIYRQSRRMSNLLNMVLDLRKMEVGNNRLKTESIDFNSWIRNSIADIADEEHAEGIEIVMELDPSITDVEFDRQKCDTVLMNILINAIKHSTEGDTITIRTSLNEDGMIWTGISDEGCGLRDIDMSRMFTRFYQSNSEEYGTGIGLSYSKILVELHGGQIGAENNPDKGATFWWTLPVKAVTDSPDVPSRAYLNELIGYDPAENIQDYSGEEFSTSGMRLMLVDDSRDLLEFMNEALCGSFAEIILASSGNKALQMLSSGRFPDIIVSDVNMPDGDGYQLCRELKENEKYSHIPVVLLTARGEEQSQSDSYRLGADAFMAKPFEVDTLMELLRNILRRKAEIRKRYLESSAEAVADYGSNEEDFILKLNRIIADHMSDPELDQQLICRELGVSRALLYNKMKAITGAGAKEYITRIRLEKAKSLIENTSLTIADISDMTGFASQSYFSTAFKAYTGMTPSQYKKQMQTED